MSETTSNVSKAHLSSASHWDEYLRKEFSKETDRACVILAAAMMDQALESLLRNYLAPVSTADDPLFDGGNAPIGTFSSRIDLAYRLGLISARFARDVHIIRKIRNDFAHNVTDCTFAKTSVRNRITELVRSSIIIEDSPESRIEFPPGPRGDFQMIVSWMNWAIWRKCEKVRPLSHASEEFGYHAFANKKEKEPSSEDNNDAKPPA